MVDKSNRTRIIGIRLTPAEYSKIETKWKATTCRKLSDYIRKSLFQKPIVTTYRNLSQDEAIAELSRLRAELNSLGNNFNQAVKKLHTLHQISEFKTWLLRFDQEKEAIHCKQDQIKKEVVKLMEKWLQ